MNPKVIVIDGKSYNSVDEMPPDVRQKYEQAMRSLPDTDGNGSRICWKTRTSWQIAIRTASRMCLNLTASNSVLVNKMKIFLRKAIRWLENLPPEVRAKYEAAMSKLDANRNGIPDFLEGMMNMNPPNQTTNISTSFGIETPASSCAPSPMSFPVHRRSSVPVSDHHTRYIQWLDAGSWQDLFLFAFMCCGLQGSLVFFHPRINCSHSCLTYISV